MKNYKKTIILGMAFINLSLNSYAKEYDLNSLLDLTTQNNIDGKIARTKVEEVEAEIENAKSEYYPTITGVIGSEARNSATDSSINTTNTVGELRIDYNLYKFGGTTNRVSSLKSLKKEEEKIVNFTETNIKRQLKKEYYEALSFREVIDILKEEINFNKTLKKQVKLKKDQGLVGAADILEIDMRDATLTNELLKLEEEFQHSLDNIRRITYIPHNEEILLKGNIPHDHFHVNEEKLVSEAMNKNLELSRTQIKVESLNFELNSSKTQKLPEINLSGRYGKMRIDEQYSNDDRSEGLIGVYIEIPLFNGGEKNSQVRKLRSKLAREKLNRDKRQNHLKIDVIHRFERMETIHKQADLAERNVANGKNYFKNVLNEYKRGIKNSIDLVSARDRLADFKKDLIEYRKEYLFAILDLETITNTTILKE